MKVLLIQLSDIHFKTHTNPVLNKTDALFEAIRNELNHYEYIYLLVSGDIAFSGKKEEYLVAFDFFTRLITQLENYCERRIKVLLIPGNHDCDFSIDSKARQNQTKFVQQVGINAFDDSVIEQFTSVQNEFFEFQDILVDCKPFISSNLCPVYNFDVGAYQISFYCYNTSFISAINEVPGSLFFPVGSLSDSIVDHKADLVVGMLHHPLNWYEPTNRREFESHLHKTVDFYLTGHEHTYSVSKIDDLNGNSVCHLEGSALQETSQPNESGFNLIAFDLENTQFKTNKFFWSSDLKKYQCDDSGDWLNYHRARVKTKKRFNLESTFNEYLEDIGGKFSHPSRLDVKLSDLYTYPKLSKLNIDANIDEVVTYLSIDSETIINDISKKEARYLFFGQESIGKTSLLKIIYKGLYSKGFLPIWINGYDIKSSNILDFTRLVKSSLCRQYGNDSITEFEQFDANNIFIIVDDFDKSKVKNFRARGKLLLSLKETYKNLVLVGNELFTIEEILTDEKVEGDLFLGFEQYEIQEFNHSLRTKLIQRWYMIGEIEYESEIVYRKRCDNALQAAALLMGVNKMIPNYPIFLLMLLQTLETNNPHDLKATSYGSYYQLLILKSLTENIRNTSELKTYQNYCTELANFFFTKKTHNIAYDEFLEFHKNFISYERFDLPDLAVETVINKLVSSGVLYRSDNYMSFKYRYVFYYFEGKYLSENIEVEKDVISNLCKKLYQTDFANIFMFLTYFSNDDFIIEQLLLNARDLFKEFKPCELGKDVDVINSLVSELPKIYLKNQSIDQVRNNENELIDEYENTKRDLYTDDSFDKLNEIDEVDSSEIDIISQLNSCFKLIEIIGQVTKNNEGSLKGPIKDQLIKETYLVALRTLNFFFTILNENTDYVVNQITEVLSDQHVDFEKIEKISKNILFGLCSQVSNMFFKKISDSIGSAKFLPKFKIVEDELNFSSIKLINFLIRLDHTSSFPQRELQTTKEKLESHMFSFHILRRMVVNHIQRYPVSYKEKQQICEFLGIPIERQLLMEAKMNKSK